MSRSSKKYVHRAMCKMCFHMCVCVCVCVRIMIGERIWEQ